jgi:hypothetical protein
MGAIWLGLKIGIGFTVGVGIVYYLWREIHAIPETRLALRFHRAGFNWAKAPQGWLSRDPNNDDWILWDERNGWMLRATDPDPSWRPSDETLDQCIALGEKYESLLRADLAACRERDSGKEHNSDSSDLR